MVVEWALQHKHTHRQYEKEENHGRSPMRANLKRTGEKTLLYTQEIRIFISQRNQCVQISCLFIPVFFLFYSLLCDVVAYMQACSKTHAHTNTHLCAISFLYLFFFWSGDVCVTVYLLPDDPFSSMFFSTVSQCKLCACACARARFSCFICVCVRVCVAHTLLLSMSSFFHFILFLCYSKSQWTSIQLHSTPL